MNMNIEDIIKQAVDEVNKKYELEAIDEAEKRGYKKGIKKGYEKGIKKGYEKGIKKGYEKGWNEENIKLAKKFKGILSNEEISEISGLSLDTVQQL